MRFRRALVVAVLATLAVGCAPPQASDDNPQQTGAAGQTIGETTGELRVWLFQEAANAAKEAVVAEAKAEFERAHPGVTVNVEYLPVDGRATRFNGAFNDKASAPDVAEFGNTDLAGYTASNGFADLTADVDAWSEAEDLVPEVLDTASVDGRTYGVPWFTGTRALYYRTDVFDELRLAPPTTLRELADAARRIRAARPDLYGIAVGGKYQFALLPYIWANGGDVATQDGNVWRSTVDSERARAGLAQYAELLADDICPPAACAQSTGSQSVAAFAGGKAGMTIGGDFNRAAVDAGAVNGKYAVIPLPGTRSGTIAPAFAGGNLLGVFRSSDRYTLSLEFVELLGGKEYQEKMYGAMGTMPTFADVQDRIAGDDELAVHLGSLGRRAMAWDDAGPLPPTTVIGAWLGADVAAAVDNDVVLCPEEHLYLDHRQSDHPDEPVPVGHLATLAHVYAYEPPDAPNVLGAQAQVWSEHLDTPRRVDYAAFPRLAAFAEVAWSHGKRDYAEFEARLVAHHLPRLDALGVEYRPLAGPHPWQTRPSTPGHPRP